jgi:ABC-type Na+ efflux pump permease subunit
MKSLVMTIVREFKLVFRDGITIYLTISPAVLALVFLFIFSSMQESSITLAADKSLPPEQLAKLESVADIELLEDLDSLKERVGGVDSIAGVSMQDGTVSLLVEGNEAQGFAESRKTLVSSVLGTDPAEYSTETVEVHHSLPYTVSMSCIFLLALFIGGSTFGLSGVSERESGVLRAVSVSPMTLVSYVLSKIVPSLVFGLIGVSACALIMGQADALPQYLLLALCSVFVSAMILFLIIAFAGNQIAAVGVLKIVMPIFLTVGISAAFVPGKLLFLYYVFPMYWQYAAIDTVIAGKEPGFQFFMILATGFAWFIPTMVVFTKKVKMKAWG